MTCVSGPHIQRAASKRKAIHRPPRGPPKYPSSGLHRSTYGGLVTLHFWKDEQKQEVGKAGYADDRWIVSSVSSLSRSDGEVSWRAFAP
jgi:hypothetical protein